MTNPIIRVKQIEMLSLPLSIIEPLVLPLEVIVVDLQLLVTILERVASIENVFQRILGNV